MNDEIINNLSSFVFNSNDKIKMSFYSFDEMLLYEKDYPVIKKLLVMRISTLKTVWSDMADTKKILLSKN